MGRKGAVTGMVKDKQNIGHAIWTGFFLTISSKQDEESATFKLVESFSF
jgi:hypothetical protein